MRATAVAIGALAVGWPHIAQSADVVVVGVTHHADAIPGIHTLRPAVFPLREVIRVVAEGAVHAQALAHVHHEAIGLFGGLDGSLAGGGREFLAAHADVVLAGQIIRERIKVQRGIGHRSRRRVAAVLLAGDRARFRHGGGPVVHRHRIAAVAGPAGDAGVFLLAEVRRPGCVDVLGHQQHLAGHDLGVFLVRGHVFRIVAVGAASILDVGTIGRDPRGHRLHQIVELVHRDVAQHGHILIGRARPVASDHLSGQLIGWGRNVPNLGLAVRIADLDHGGAAEANLLLLFRAELTTRQQQGRQSDGDKLVQRLHCGAPGRVAGSTTPVAGYSRAKP